jgi:hypothetical protein
MNFDRNFFVEICMKFHERFIKFKQSNNLIDLKSS